MSGSGSEENRHDVYTEERYEDIVLGNAMEVELSQTGKRYIITGAAGHLGSTVIRHLLKIGSDFESDEKSVADTRDDSNVKVYGFLLDGTPPAVKDERISYFYGDVTRISTLKEMFQTAFSDEGVEVYVIHTAAMISIEDRIFERLEDVNVNGTRNILKMCAKYGVRRLVHVSSVHAIPEMPEGQRITEPETFCPELVRGAYAKTKAMAVNLVIEEIKNGLDAVIVFPSGMIGPYDRGSNHLIQMISDFMSGKLKACVKGGYDFVDVRDVAEGCLSATINGKRGEGYILSGEYLSIEKLLNLVATYCDLPPVPVLPLFLAKMGLPFIRLYSKLSNHRPLYTKYSLYTLGANSLFDYSKAVNTLGYKVKTIDKSLLDTVHWIKSAKEFDGV